MWLIITNFHLIFWSTWRLWRFFFLWQPGVICTWVDDSKHTRHLCEMVTVDRLSTCLSCCLLMAAEMYKQQKQTWFWDIYSLFSLCAVLFEWNSHCLHLYSNLCTMRAKLGTKIPHRQEQQNFKVRKIPTLKRWMSCQFENGASCLSGFIYIKEILFFFLVYRPNVASHHLVH